MIAYVVEGEEYEDRRILGIYLTEEKAKKKAKEWDKVNSYQGAVISNKCGGDGIKRYIINEA